MNPNFSVKTGPYTHKHKKMKQNPNKQFILFRTIRQFFSSFDHFLKKQGRNIFT